LLVKLLQSLNPNLEADRFDKDFAVADRKIREVNVDKRHQGHDNLRQERL